MKVRILLWNVRGANDATKRKLNKIFLKTLKVDVVSSGNEMEILL